MYADLEQLENGRWQLRFTRMLAHPPENVWRAITEPEQLAHWFPTTIEGEYAAGAPLRFSFAEDQYPSFDGEMLVYEPVGDRVPVGTRRDPDGGRSAPRGREHADAAR
jgi:hypothetical protein